MSIFRKLLLSFLTVALLIWAVAFSSFFIIRKTLIHSAEQESLFAAHLLMRGVDKDIRDEFSQLKIRMQDPGLLELLKASNESFEKIPDVRATIDRIDQAWIATPKGSFLPLMKEIWGQPFSEELRQKSRASEEQCGYPVFSEIFVTNRYGVNVAMTGRTTDYRQDDEAWWKEAWEKGKIVEDVKFDESSQTYALTLAVRIDDRQGVPLGVAKGVLNIRQILDFLEENRERQHLKNARIFLLDSHRRIIYPTEQFGKEAPESWREFSTENPLKPHECVRLMKGAVGGGKIAAHIVSQGYMDYPGLGWSVVLENDVGEVLASLKTIEVFSLSVSALATFLALILGVFFSQRFSVSLKKLIAVAERCGKGDFEVKVGIVSQDEFGTLARGFEAMAGNLKNKTTSIENLDREIEERKLLEKISLENALFLQKLMNSIPSPVFYKDISGVYIGCNRAFEAFFGISQKELIGKKDEELFPPELAKMYQKKDAELFVLPGIQVYEASVGNATGKPRSIVFYKATFTGPSGEVQGIIGVIMDATIRRRAEEMLQESEERHRTLFESASDAIMILEPPFWKFATGNPAAIKMFKAKNREEFTSLGLWDLSPERQSDGCASAEMAKEMIETAMREGSCFFEWTHRRMSGENFPATVLFSRMEIKGERMIQATVRDISVQKIAETQIRKLSQAVEQSPSCVVITDKDGRIEYVNQKFTKLTGYSFGEAVGQNSRILKSGEQPPEFYKDLWDTILSGKEWQGLFCNKKKSGELYWESAHIAPIRDEKGEISYFVAVKEDITYQRQIEKKLRHSLRMEVVGRMASGIAHDFNNMLTVINGYSGYLMGKMRPEDPYYDKICLIRDAGDCAATIVRQLLNLSRTEVPKPQLIRVDESIGRIKHMINRLLGEDVELKVDYAVEAGCVKMDSGQMEQVFLNLLVNAREAMPIGGVLTVATDLVRMEEVQEELMLSKKREGEFIRITVKDTGVGIDPAVKARIFEPFFTTKKRRMNTGLGLSIVYGIVEQAGGAISFESQLGKGTTFRIYLPRAQESGEIQERVSLEDLPRGKGKILLVEDENQVREFALQVLRERGYDVRAARGGEEALTMLEEDPGRKYDLVLTDLTMPKMNGKELVIRIRGKIPELKVIFMSGYSEQTVADMKDSCFLQKPFSHRALTMKVWEVLGR